MHVLFRRKLLNYNYLPRRILEPEILTHDTQQKRLVGNLPPAFGRREVVETDAEYKLDKFAVNRPAL